MLAGILVTVGIGVMDYKGLKAIPSMPKVEVAIMIVVMLLSVFWDLVYAVGIGLVLASLLFMKKMGDVTAKDSTVDSLKGLEKDTGLKNWIDEINFPENLKEEVFVKHLNGPVFFGATSELQQLAKQIPGTASHVILRMDKVPYMDQSGVYTLEEIILSLEQRNIRTFVTGLQTQPEYLMKRIDIIPDLIPSEHLFENFDQCVEYIKDKVADVY